MTDTKGKDIEQLIRESVFPNPAFRRDLRSLLLRQDRLLDLEELAAVAGGVDYREKDKREAWPDQGHDPK